MQLVLPFELYQDDLPAHLIRCADGSFFDSLTGLIHVPRGTEDNHPKQQKNETLAFEEHLRSKRK